MLAALLCNLTVAQPDTHDPGKLSAQDYARWERFVAAMRKKKDPEIAETTTLEAAVAKRLRWEFLLAPVMAEIEDMEGL